MAGRKTHAEVSHDTKSAGGRMPTHANFLETLKAKFEERTFHEVG